MQTSLMLILVYFYSLSFAPATTTTILALFSLRRRVATTGHYAAMLLVLI